jgi:hypothetical protein
MGQSCVVEVKGRPIQFRSTSVRRYFKDPTNEEKAPPVKGEEPLNEEDPPLPEEGGSPAEESEADNGEAINDERGPTPRRSGRQRKIRTPFDNLA